MAEVKGSCARVASRRWCQSTLIAVPACLRRASAQAPGARCVSRHPLRCDTHSTSSAITRDLSSALQDELVARCVLATVLAGRHSVDPSFPASLQSVLPVVPILHVRLLLKSRQ